MKKKVLSFLFLLSLVFSVSAQKVQVAKADPAQANLRAHIEFLASDKLEGRRIGESGAIAAAGYIANQFAKIKLRPAIARANGKAGYLQEFPYTKLNTPTVSGYNVVGILDGTDKQLRKEAIVIGAHYDHLGHGGEGSLAANSTEIHHGADDNASGTAAIIELARQFAKEKTNKRTIIFIAFSGEEEGLFGSKFYVNNAVFPIENTVAMINLDMVGRLKDEKLTIGGIGTASEWKQWIEALNSPNGSKNGLASVEDAQILDVIYKGLKQRGIEDVSVYSKDREVTFRGNVPQEKIPRVMEVALEANIKKVINQLNFERPSSRLSENPFNLQLNEDGFGPSDHSSFYTKKVPVLFFFTGTHLDYHKHSDTADKINYEGEEKVVNFVAAIARAVDQNPVKPTYTVAKSTSATGGRSGFSISLGTIPSYADSTDGMVIDGVRDDSPASRAGLKSNDKIVMLAGKAVNNVQDYTKILGEMKADVEYEIVIVRRTERLTMKITPVKRG